jgi:hypothetical protein
LQEFEGVHRNGTYHLAGFVLGINAGVRYDFLKKFSPEPASKVAMQIIQMSFFMAMVRQASIGGHCNIFSQ